MPTDQRLHLHTPVEQIGDVAQRLSGEYLTVIRIAGYRANQSAVKFTKAFLSLPVLLS